MVQNESYQKYFYNFKNVVFKNAMIKTKYSSIVVKFIYIINYLSIISNINIKYKYTYKYKYKYKYSHKYT